MCYFWLAGRYWEYRWCKSVYESHENIRQNVLLKARSFWLTTNIGILKSRIKSNKRRPVINQIGLKNIENLFKKRKEFYSLADHKIECEKLTLNQISDKIIKLYENN